MAVDGSDSANFTVRLINQVTAPARAVQQSLGGVEKSLKSVKRVMDAPAAKRGAVSEWDKMAAAAKRSQAADFAKITTAAQKKREDVQKKLTQAHADHGIGAQAVEAGSSLALFATEALAAAGVAAAAAVGYVGFKFVEASVQAGVFAEKSQLAIGFLTNNAPQAGQQFDEVRHMAETLGLQVDETVGSFERLLAMQFSVGKSKDLIKMSADMQAIGASGEEVQRILYAISEIKSMGTLQKRQERMLQMAGISGTLIDQALMKHTGITDKGKLDKARAKGQIGADVAVDAIMDAVMHKTHESKLGDAGAAFASQTVQGMTNAFHAKLDNLFTDVGALLMPGVIKVFELFSDIFTAVTTNPKIIAVGQTLLKTFNRFTDWVDQNWGAIVSTFVTGAEWLGSTIEFIVGMFDRSTIQGKMTIPVLEGIAAVFAVVALAGFAMMLPIYLLIGAIGLIVLAIDWVITKINDFLSFTGGTPTGAPANDNGIQAMNATGGLNALSGMADSTESGSRVDSHAVDMSGMSIHVTSPDGASPEEIAQKIHNEMAKIMRQANG